MNEATEKGAASAAPATPLGSMTAAEIGAFLARQWCEVREIEDALATTTDDGTRRHLLREHQRRLSRIDTAEDRMSQCTAKTEADAAAMIAVANSTASWLAMFPMPRRYNRIVSLSARAARLLSAARLIDA